MTLWNLLQDTLVAVLLALLISFAGIAWVDYEVPGTWPDLIGPSKTWRAEGVNGLECAYRPGSVVRSDRSSKPIDDLARPTLPTITRSKRRNSRRLREEVVVVHHEPDQHHHRDKQKVHPRPAPSSRRASGRDVVWCPGINGR